ncbi:hypothetical protein B0H10DRAFT_1958428 [Mycena sp. CBHHK59/15]|nr:hypothetical protein B0H10DRAFT_1958428 [Mycena sp. CBHHK59/15]
MAASAAAEAAIQELEYIAKARKDKGSLFWVLEKKKLRHVLAESRLRRTGTTRLPTQSARIDETSVCARVGYALHRVYVRTEGGLSVAPLCYASVGRRERGPLGGEIP